jgi:hypothetical protein
MARDDREFSAEQVIITKSSMTVVERHNGRMRR